MLFVKCQNLNFWQICNFDFVLFWHEIWYGSIVWVIIGRRGVFSECRHSSCSCFDLIFLLFFRMTHSHWEESQKKTEACTVALLITTSLQLGFTMSPSMYFSRLMLVLFRRVMVRHRIVSLTSHWSVVFQVNMCKKMQMLTVTGLQLGFSGITGLTH